jgi:hypothetical protein
MNGKDLLRALVLLSVAALASACDGASGETVDECTSSADCDASNATKGWLCQDGACVPCDGDEQCAADPHYGQYATCIAGMCTPGCPNTVAGCPCVEGECGEGLICDPQTGLCREPYACGEIECLPHQLCVEGDAGGDDAGTGAVADAYCDEDCEDWWLWDDALLECLPWLNCEEGQVNSILADCLDQQRTCLDLGLTAQCGDCLAGFVEEAGECRAALTCADLDCAGQHRDCTEAAGNADAACLGCLEGHIEDDDACYATTCDWGVPGSIRYECQTQKRVCDDSGTFAQCGDCIAWYTDDGGTCRQVKDCTQIGCVALHRECVPAALHADAWCGSCMGGYKDLWGDCVPLTGAVCSGGGSNDISAICAGQHRDCIQPECATPPCSPAYCGECTWQANCESNPLAPGLACFVELPQTGQCEQYIPCSLYGGCAPFNRNCDDDPTAHCTTCIFTEDVHTDVDYIEDEITGLCRPAVTCASLSCGAGQQCHPHTPTADAFCHPGCESGEIWSVWGCISCPPCNGEGEDGHWPFPTLDGRCICKTEAGYFYNIAGDISAYPCDEDGDGWVRESARSAIDSDDPQVVKNARCDVRVVDRFVLENRVVNWFDKAVDCAGDEPCAGYLVIQLDDPVALYESDRNDDQYLLELFGSSAPYYGNRQPQAAELNRLTKFCVAGGDYNDNMVDDIEEWDYRPLPPGFPIRLEPFNWFSYFAELHRGWYEPPVGNAKYGRYHIREKSRRRSAAPGDRVPLVYSAPENEQVFHETCALRRDPAFDAADPAIGFDFARWSPSKGTYGWALTWDPGMTRLTVPDGLGGWMSVAYGWDGMGFHSQYKCVRIVENGNPDYDTEARPHLLTLGDINARNLKPNDCGISGSQPSAPPPAWADAANPYDPPISCVTKSPAVDFVGWATKRYASYSAAANYPGGCVNQIVASRGRCGTCGLGRWTDGGGTDLGGPDGPANHGDFDVPGGCDDIDLSPIADGDFPLDELECDDESSNSSFLFVDSFFGDDTSYYGSRRRPYASITAALDRADYLNGITYGGQRVVAVVVTAGDYEETVTPRDGVSILGGFTVSSVDGEPYWIRTDPPAANPSAGAHAGLTRVKAVTVQENPKRLVGLEARDVEAPTLVDRLFVDVENNGQTGVSLFGVLADDSPGLYLRDCRVRTGPALQGADGSQVPASPQHGANGYTTGEPRYNACTLNPEYATGQRGGGTVNCSSYPSWTNCSSLWGQPHPAGGQGGTNGCSAQPACATCSTTQNGSDGANGIAGANATPVHSSLAASGWWVGGAQVTGQRGGTGRGGGGGAGYWTNSSCGKVNGGGGGAGGCGGSPGVGGEHGGNSLALVVTGSSDVIVENCTFQAGDAGAGGQAGPGGLGGNGGTGATPTVNPGAHRGGNGGKGGDGGHGTGGNGGVSCALLIQNGATLDDTGTLWSRGDHGAAGPGVSSSANPGNPSSAPGYTGQQSLAAPVNSGLTCAP